MRALIQKVLKADITIDQKLHENIGKGMLVFLGVHHKDLEKNAIELAEKLVKFRIFEDSQGKMNRSIEDIQGAFLVVSQFTLYAETSKGRRPSFLEGALPEKAEKLYEFFCAKLREISGLQVETGVFGSYMQVALVNDGPATFLIEK